MFVERRSMIVVVRGWFGQGQGKPWTWSIRVEEDTREA